MRDWMNHPTPEGSPSHPSAELWLAFLEHEVTEDAAHRMQDHLLECGECFELLQAVEAFRDPEPEAEEEGSSEAEPGDRPRLRDAEERQAPPRLPGWLPGLVAASLAVVAGLAGWQYAQRKATYAASRPEAAVTSVVVSSAPQRSGRVGVAEVVFPEGGGSVALDFDLSAQEVRQVRGYRILDADERLVFAGALRPNDEDSLGLLLLRSRRFSTGHYRLQLCQEEGAAGSCTPAVVGCCILEIRVPER